MAGNSFGALKGKTGFGKSGYKPGGMITKMNSMKGGSASGVGRLEKAKMTKGKKGGKIKSIKSII